MFILISFPPLGEGVKKILGAKGTSNERSRANVKKTLILGHETVFLKNLGVDEFLHGIMLAGWT
jgi:hypothetical protein